jgi:uncharacterized C2H2 Zn-finger protein
MGEHFFKCPFCENVVFPTGGELSIHLKTFVEKSPPVNAPLINKTDHVRLYKEFLRREEFKRILKVEVQKTANFFKCPFCDCIFFHKSDISKHLLTFVEKVPPVNAPLINQSDHLRLYRKLHDFLESGQDNPYGWV